MVKSLGCSIINMYLMGACAALGIANQDALSEDLENDPFLNSALRRFTCKLYYRFDSFLAPLSIGIITRRHHLWCCCMTPACRAHLSIIKMEEQVEQVQQVEHVEKKTNLSTWSKYEGLAAYSTAELMTGFWFSVGTILPIKMVSSLEELISRKCYEKGRRTQVTKEPQQVTTKEPQQVTTKEPQQVTTKEPQQVTKKNPNKVKVSKRLAEHNCRKREEKKAQTTERDTARELNQYYGTGAIIAVGAIGGLGYYIYRSKKGKEVKDASITCNPTVSQQPWGRKSPTGTPFCRVTPGPQGPHPQTNKFEMD